MKNGLIVKDPHAGKDQGTGEDEMVGRHHRLSGGEFEQTPGNGEGQGRLMRCKSMGLQSQTQQSD